MIRSATFLLFALVLLALVVGVFQVNPAKPIYSAAKQHPTTPLLEFEAHEEVTYAFEAPSAQISGLWLHHLFNDPEVDVLVQIENRTSGDLLLRTHFTASHQYFATFPPKNEEGDRITVTYSTIRSQKDQFPALIQAIKRTDQAPRFPVQLSIDGEEVSTDEGYPLFQIRYHHTVRPLLFLWPLALAVGGFLALGRERLFWRMGYLLLLGLASSVTSYLVWLHHL
ncbi:MAG: hypothetical protein AAGJ31_15215, partial [Verrucomicrobiota bacterium]